MITLYWGANSYAIAESAKKKRQAFFGTPEVVDAAELEPRHLPDLFTGVSLFSSERLIVIRGATSNKVLWTELEQWIPRVPKETELILIDASPDKRTKTYKQLQKHGTVLEFKELKEPELVSWLQTIARAHQQDIPLDTARYLISYVGHDQWRLENEFKKLVLASKPLTRELIQDIAEPYPEATAFELLDSLFAKDAKRIESLLELLRQREDPYQFFGLLSLQVLALLALVSGGSRRPQDIASDIGVHPFVVSKLAQTARQQGRSGVEKLVDKLAYCDMRIKTSGVDPWRQLHLTLLEVVT